MYSQVKSAKVIYISGQDKKRQARHLEAGKMRQEQFMIRQVSTSWKKLWQLSTVQDNSANFSKSQDKTSQEDRSGGWFKTPNQYVW